MTLEQIYERMKKENPYYNGSQAQKEEQAGMVVKNNTVNHTDESAQIHQDYMNNQPTFNKYITGAPTYKEQLKDTFIQAKRSAKQLGKNFISGTGSGVRGIIDNTFQETENNLKKGENSNKNLWQHILKSTAYTLNPNVSFIDNIISSNKNATNILKDKNKSGYEKVANIVTDGVTNVVDTSTTGKKGLDASIELLGKLSQNNSEKISDKVQNVQNKVDEPFKKYDEKVQKDNNNFGNVEKFLFNVSNSLGNMAPSIVASAVTKNPNIGLATMGYSVKGQSTEEAREKGQELQKAIDIGNTKGAIEVGTELLTGGINFFGKGALDDIAKRGIDSKVKNQVLNFIAKKGYDFAGEIGEETVSDILNTMLDKGTTDPNIKYSIKDWSDTALSTLLSTAVLNTIGGVYTKKAYNQNAQELINNKELPMQSYQYEKSENTKINALRQDANKYFNNTEQSHNFVNMLEKIITDKNVEIKFDANLKTPDGRVANGSYSNGVITINPNSNKAGEFIAIHELTHAIGTDSMKNIIETYRKSNTEFDTSVKKLLQNYNSSEITEEALSDVSAQLFGNQEFINNIAQNNPNIFQKIYSEIKYLWHQFRGYKNQDQFVEDLYYKWTQAYNSSNKLNETSNYYIETIEDFDEIKYNNAKELKLPKREYAILSGIVNSDSNIKPGINYVETTNATYEVYFKEIGEFKVVGKIVDGGYNDTITNGNIQGTGNTGNAKSRMQVHSSTIQQSRTGTRNDEISNFNQKRTGISDTSIGNGSSNSSNIKYSIQESENNSGSFNLQKNRFDVSGNENLANAQTLFYRTRDDGQYYVQATDGSGKITYDGVFYGEKQLARSLGEEIANKIVNTSESTNNEIYLQSDNIKSETDYMMAHRPTETGAYASNITKGTGEWDSLMPEDVYEHPEWYFDMNQEYSKESFKVLKQIKNNPNAEITIYRATTGNKINKGDWVTLSKKYAEYHNNSQFNGKGNIIELKVKAKDVQYAGDDINEFGYYPSENIKYNKIDANMSVQDNQGRTLTKEQQEYFKDSKVRDENGNLEVMYHGTDNGGFNTFDINKFGKNDNGWLGKGFYLTNDFDYAESYAKELYSDEYTQNGEVKETYINLKNPYILTDEKYSRNPTLLQEELGAKNSTEVTEILKTKGYDGVLLEYEDYKGNNFKEVMVFNSNQIKNIDNTNPTDNPDIRFSQNNTTWQSYLNKNYKATGTRTNLQDIKLPTKEWIENRQKLKKSQNNIPIAKEYINKNTLNPLQISNLTENDVTTTPKLPDIKYKTDKGKKSDFYDNLMNKTGMLNDDLRKIIKNKDDIINEFNGYTDKEIKNISSNKIAIAKNKSDITNFVAQSQKIPGNFKMYMGKVKDNVSNFVKNNLGINIDNYNISLKTDAIRHTLKGHSNIKKEQLRGQIPITELDFANIPLIINNADNIIHNGENKQGKPVIQFEKNIDGNNVVITYVSDKHNTLELQTMYKFKNNKKMDSVTTSNAINTLNRTSKTNSDTNPINNIIPQNQNYASSNQKVLNPAEISNLTQEDVTTTPRLPNIAYKTDKGNNSKFYNNLMNKTGMLNENLREIIKNQDDIKYYEGVTNVQSLREANERLQKDGSKEALRWFSKDLSDKNTTVSASEVAEGWILLKQYQDSGDYESAVSVAKKMRDMATKSGQALQAYSIQARLTPEGMFQYAQSELQEAFKKFSKNKTQEWIDEHKSDFDLKPEETQAIIQKVKEAQELPNDSQEKKEKLAEINKIITEKLPPEKGAGIKAWMRISMLFNPKTQVRNILGNAVIAPVNSVSDVFSTIADKALSKKTGVRTTGLSNPIQNIKGFGKGLYNSYNDFKKGINTRDVSGNKFEIGQGKSFKDKGLGKILNKTDSLLNFVLDAGDRPFYEATFTNSINNQLILNDTDVVTQDMIDIATNEALSRTWQDNNAYTHIVLNFRNVLNGKIDIGKIHTKGLSYGLGDILIPFAKTPANLTKAIIDYSPVGVVTSLIEGNNVRKAISRGDLTAQQQHKFVQDLGKATAGSMLYILGYALAKAGITSGESDEDKDVANFIKNNLGTSQYSIKIGGKTFTYDWAQPIAAPIAMTANLVNKENKEENLLEKITSTLDVPMNMILERSFMQSIQEVLSNNSGVVEGLIQQILDLPSRAIPTLSKQITDMTDTTQRTTYEKGKPIETAVNKVKAKVPGLSKQLAPVSDTLGNDVKKYGGETNPFLYAFHTFINPANVNSNQKNKAGSEVYKVYQKTGDKTIFPRQAEYTQIIDGTKITLTSNERYQYQKTSGKYYSNVVNELLNSNTYKKLSAAEKSKILIEIASDSNELAKEKLAKEKKLKYERPDTDVKIDELVTNGLEYGNAYIYKTQVNSIKGDKKDDKAISGSSNAKKAKYIMNMDTKDNQKDMMLSLLTDTDTKPTVSDLKKLNGNYLTYMQQSGKKDDKGVSARDKYMMYIDAGIPVTTLNKYYDEIGDIEGIKNSNGKTISGSKKKALFNYINSLSLNATQKKILFTKCNSSYGKNYKSEIHAYINSLNISKQRKEQIWNELYD